MRGVLLFAGVLVICGCVGAGCNPAPSFMAPETVCRVVQVTAHDEVVWQRDSGVPGEFWGPAECLERKTDNKIEVRRWYYRGGKPFIVEQDGRRLGNEGLVFKDDDRFEARIVDFDPPTLETREGTACFDCKREILTARYDCRSSAVVSRQSWCTYRHESLHDDY